MILDILPFAEEEFKTHNFDRAVNAVPSVCTVCGIRYSFNSGYYYEAVKDAGFTGIRGILPMSCQEYIMRKALE